MIMPKMADGLTFDFACGVYGRCTELREFQQDRGQADVPALPPPFALALAAGTAMTCAEG